MTNLGALPSNAPIPAGSFTPTANAYTQTYTTAARTHAASALNENVTITLLTDVAGQIDATNAAVNELKKLVNALIDDLQAQGIVP